MTPRGVYRKEVLDNGFVILTERMPEVQSISIGVWIPVGSRKEEERQAHQPGVHLLLCQGSG
jgi:predicted Zn-dependent peptidase